MRQPLVLLVCLFVWLFVCILGGCASLAKDQTVCPEYRSLRCPAGASCSYDSARGCRVCACDPVNRLGPVSPPDENVPPPVNVSPPVR